MTRPSPLNLSSISDREKMDPYPTISQHYQKGLAVRTPSSVASFRTQQTRPQSSDLLSGRVSPFLLHKKGGQNGRMRASEDRAPSPSPSAVREQLNKYKESTSPIIKKQFEAKNKSMMENTEDESSIRTNNSSFFDDKRSLPLLKGKQEKKKRSQSPKSARGFPTNFEDEFSTDYMDTPRIGNLSKPQKLLTSYDDEKYQIKILIVNDSSRSTTKYQPKSNMLRDIMDQTDLDIPMTDKITKTEYEKLERRVSEELAHLSTTLLPGQLKKLKKKRLTELLRSRQTKSEKMMQGLSRIDILLQDYETAQNNNSEVEFLSVDDISDLVFKEQVDRVGVINQSRDRIAEVTKDLDQRYSSRTNILKGIMSWIRSYDEDGDILTEDKEEMQEIEGMLDFQNENVLEPLGNVQENIGLTLERLKSIFEEYKIMRFSLLDFNAETFKDEEKRKSFLKKITEKFKKIETDIGDSITDLDGANSAVVSLKTKLKDKEKFITALVERDKRHVEFYAKLKDRYNEQQGMLKGILSRLKLPEVKNIIDIGFILTGRRGLSDEELDLDSIERQINEGFTEDEELLKPNYEILKATAAYQDMDTSDDEEIQQRNRKKKKKNNADLSDSSDIEEGDTKKTKKKKDGTVNADEDLDDDFDTSSLEFDMDDYEDEMREAETKRTDISHVWMLDNCYNYELDKKEFPYIPGSVDLEKFTPAELKLYLTADGLFKTVKRMENDRMRSQDFDANELQRLIDMEEAHYMKEEDQEHQSKMAASVIEKLTEEIDRLKSILVEKGVDSSSLVNPDLGKTVKDFHVMKTQQEEKHAMLSKMLKEEYSNQHAQHYSNQTQNNGKQPSGVQHNINSSNLNPVTGNNNQGSYPTDYGGFEAKRPNRGRYGSMIGQAPDNRQDNLELRGMDNERRKWLMDKERAEADLLKLNTEIKKLRVAKAKMNKGDPSQQTGEGDATGMGIEEGGTSSFDVSNISLFKGATEEFKPTSEILREIEDIYDSDELKYIINIILMEADRLIDYIYYMHKKIRKFLSFLNFFTNMKGPNNSKYSEEEFLADWINLNKKIDKSIKAKKSKNGAESPCNSPRSSPISPKRRGAGVSHREAVRDQLNFLIEETEDESKTKRNPSKLSKSITALMMKIYNTVKQYRYKVKVKGLEESSHGSNSPVKRDRNYKSASQPFVPKPPKESRPAQIKVSAMTRMLKHQEEAKKRWEEKKMRILQEELAKGQMFYNVKTSGTGAQQIQKHLYQLWQMMGKHQEI
ncbi:predicted protein [Naegleria gruberi]|uniref:Predicted protein n=1 Tax=Naegleria gruberi TaxID=5762 RepID=D2V755_NAEGR|nr:uncharacterized protein NAEGRDRAFT_64675 [Naegleria gruberi]EFC47201.1 predicted protein [Naegleria gruberi]|eukprot:XP_002679945.1 predicted protein [Naegleria gruberi strain NEG-M]